MGDKSTLNFVWVNQISNMLHFTGDVPLEVRGTGEGRARQRHSQHHRPEVDAAEWPARWELDLLFTSIRVSVSFLRALSLYLIFETKKYICRSWHAEKTISDGFRMSLIFQNSFVSIRGENSAFYLVHSFVARSVCTSQVPPTFVPIRAIIGFIIIINK